MKTSSLQTCTIIAASTEDLSDRNRLHNILSHCKYCSSDHIRIRIAKSDNDGLGGPSDMSEETSFVQAISSRSNITVEQSTHSKTSSSYYYDLKGFKKVLLASSGSRTLSQLPKSVWNTRYDILAAPVFEGVDNPISHCIADYTDSEYIIFNPRKIWAILAALEKLHPFYHDLYHSQCAPSASHTKASFANEGSIGHLISRLEDLSLTEVFTYLAKRIDRNLKCADHSESIAFSFGELPHILFNENRIIPISAARHENEHYREWWKDKQIPLPLFYCIKIICTSHALYIANSIAEAIDSHSIKCSICCLEPGTDLGKYKPGVLEKTIVIAPNVFSNICFPFTAYQIEQSTSDRWFQSDYIEKLQSADHILDYNIDNIRYLTEKGIPARKIYYAPIPQSKSGSAESNLLNFRDRDIDVLFYGDCNSDRRKKIENYLRKSTNLKVLFLSEVYGDELVDISCRSKCIINLHYYTDSLLETTRIREALSRGCVVVSETSPDMCTYSDLKKIVIWVQEGDLKALNLALTSLCTSPKAWQDARNSVKLYLEEYSDSVSAQPNWYQRFFSGVGVFNLDPTRTYYSPREEVAEPKHKLAPESVIHFVLSLPETPSRLDSFLQRNPSYTSMFWPFPAVKCEIGWIGCALSYVSMANYLLKSQCNYMEVCEDDATIPPVDDSKFSKIKKWLFDNPSEWDIFCGLVTNATPKTFRMIKCINLGGITLVFFKGMTGTVHNIYNRKAAHYISTWNPKSGNIYDWSIDRFLERSSDLICVATVPFASAQADEEKSTLWNSHASNADHYSKMILGSENYIKTLLKSVPKTKNHEPQNI